MTGSHTLGFALLGLTAFACLIILWTMGPAAGARSRPSMALMQPATNVVARSVHKRRVHERQRGASRSLLVDRHEGSRSTGSARNSGCGTSDPRTSSRSGSDTFRSMGGVPPPLAISLSSASHWAAGRAGREGAADSALWSPRHRAEPAGVVRELLKERLRSRTILQAVSPGTGCF